MAAESIERLKTLRWYLATLRGPLTPEQEERRRRYREMTPGERLARLKVALETLRALDGGLPEPPTFLKEKTPGERCLFWIETLRRDRERYEHRDEGGQVVDAPLERGDSGVKFSGVQCHPRESRKPGGRLQVAERSV